MGGGFALERMPALGPTTAYEPLVGFAIGLPQLALASVAGANVYGLLIVRASLPCGELIFHLIGLVIAASIVAHSSTDALVARWFCRRDEAGAAARQAA